MFGERTIVLQISQTLGSVISAPDHNINLAKLNEKRSKSNNFYPLYDNFELLLRNHNMLLDLKKTFILFGNSNLITMDCTHLNILGPMALYSIIILTLYRNDRIMLKVIKSNQNVNLAYHVHERYY